MTRTSLLMSLLACATVLSACGGGGSSDGTTASTTSTTSTTSTASSAPPASSTLDALVSTTVPGYPHAVNIYRAAGATRAIVLLHGGGGDLNAVAYQVGLNSSALITTTGTINWAWLHANRVTLVVPQGQHIASNAGATTWSNYAMISGQDDKAFLQALAAKVRSDYGLADVTLMGHSMGGAMTNRMWCESPATFNRYVSLAGPTSATFNQTGTPCAPGSAAPPYMGIIGDSDGVMQTAGAWEAATWHVNPALVLSSADAWVNPVVIGEFYRQQARAALMCGEAVASTGYATAGNVDTWTNCAGRLVLKRVRGADHGVASIDAQMGAGSSLDVMDAVMAFAAAH